MNLVVDTNVLLDLWVFEDPRTMNLRAVLEHIAAPGQRHGAAASTWQGDPVQWLATAAMREEFRRVLAYPHLAARMQANALTEEALLARFDTTATLCPEAPKAPFSCKDADDQKFIDLGVAHQAVLLSKDKAVLSMRKRLERLNCWPRAAL